MSANTPRYDLDTDITLGGDNPSDYLAVSQAAMKYYIDHSSGGIIVDQTFDGTSENAQSGVAITGELENYVLSDSNNSISISSRTSIDFNAPETTDITANGLPIITSYNILSNDAYLTIGEYLNNYGIYLYDSDYVRFFYAEDGSSGLSAYSPNRQNHYAIDLLPSGISFGNENYRTTITVPSNGSLAVNGLEVILRNNIDSSLSTTSENPVQNKVIAQAIEDISLAKNPNLNLIGGSLNIDSGNISGFSTTDYMQFPFVFNFNGYTWTLEMGFTTGSDITTQQNILDSYYGVAFAINNGKFLMALSSNGSSWDIGNTSGTYSVQANTAYSVKIAWDGTDYTLSYALDETNYTTDITIVSSAVHHSTQEYVGGEPELFGSGSQHPFTGTINLNKWNLIVNGLEVWLGMDDVGLGSRANIDLSNLTSAGIDTIRLNSPVQTVNNTQPDSNGNISIEIPTNYVTTDTAQDISGKKTFLGEKAIYFKQQATWNKLGFTLYNPSNVELGALELRPNTISGASLLALNCPQTTGGYVGFRYWGSPAVNIVAPKVATAGNYFMATHITDGTNTVTASNTGLVNISSLLPDVSNYVTNTSLATTLSDYVLSSDLSTTLADYALLTDIPTVDQTFDSTSTNAQSGVAIQGAGFLQNTATATDSLTILGTTNNRGYSVLIGAGTTAGSDYNTVIGNTANGGGSYATALGYYARANAQHATAIGHSSYADYQDVTAVGHNSQATAAGTLAVGSNSMATEQRATSIGYSSQATQYQATALGYEAKATASSALQIGTGTNSTANTLQVSSYTLLDTSTGLIPDARISSNIARTSAIPDVSNFVTNSSLATTLADYVTNTSLTTILTDYVLSSDLSTTLTNYVTNSSLATTLSDYVLSSDLSTTLADYVTNSSLTTTLDDYATKQWAQTNANALYSAIQTWVTNQGYTTNVGTVTSVNNTQPDASGNVTLTIPDTATWGNITGTLSNQIDLQTALNAKQNTISDLSTIRNGASLGATALQPNDNITKLVNNAGYITSADLPTNHVTTDTAQSISGQKTFTSTIKSSANNSLALTQSTGEAFGVTVTRTDANNELKFGIGSGGDNRGIWDVRHNKWAFNIADNGKAYALGNEIASKSDLNSLSPLRYSRYSIAQVNSTNKFIKLASMTFTQSGNRDFSYLFWVEILEASTAKCYALVRLSARWSNTSYTGHKFEILEKYGEPVSSLEALKNLTYAYSLDTTTHRITAEIWLEIKSMSYVSYYLRPTECNEYGDYGNTSVTLSNNIWTYYNKSGNASSIASTAITSGLTQVKVTDATGVRNENDLSKVIKTWIGTKAQYDAIATKDANTLYNVEGVGLYKGTTLISNDGADNTLSNVSSIDSNSAVATALNGKANTDLSNLSSTGQAVIDGKADTSLSNLSATGKSVIDGQWVSKYKQIDTTTSIHTTKHNLGTTGTGALSYLPADCTTYDYEVFVTVYGATTSSGVSHGYAYNKSTATNGQYGRVSCNANARHGNNSFALPIYNGEMWTSVGTTAFGSSFNVTLLGYRRLGTNT